MAIDQSKVGNVAAVLMDQLAETYDENAEIETVMLVVTVDHGEHDTIHYRTSEHVPKHLALGILDMLAHKLRTDES